MPGALQPGWLDLHPALSLGTHAAGPLAVLEESGLTSETLDLIPWAEGWGGGGVTDPFISRDSTDQY